MFADMLAEQLAMLHCSNVALRHKDALLTAALAEREKQVAAKLAAKVRAAGQLAGSVVCKRDARDSVMREPLGVGHVICRYGIGT